MRTGNKENIAGLPIQSRYEILEIAVDGQQERGTDRTYLSTDALFDVVNTEHQSAGQVARDVSDRKVGELYANATKQMVQLMRDMSAQKEQNQERAGCKTYHLECGEFTLPCESFPHAVATRWG